MASDESRRARPGRGIPDGAGEGGLQRPLVLELVIAEAEPLTGMVGPAGGGDRIRFRGWIDLMSAIRTLYAAHA
jgi:hypothetical protein